MTPSSCEGYARQPNRGAASSRKPCHGQMRVPQSTLPVASSAPRCGHAPGPTCNVPCCPRQATNSIPATEVPTGFVRMLSLAANAYQLPLGRRCDRRTAASMTAGAA